MNVLLVSSKYMPEYSGSGLRAHNLYKRLVAKNKNLSVTFLASSHAKNSNSTYEYENVVVHRIANKVYPKLSSNNLIRKYQIFKNFSSEYNDTKVFLNKLQKKPDIIHIFGETYSNVGVIEYANKNKIPLLIELCNDMDDPHHYIPFPFKLWLSGKPKFNYKFICLSKDLKNVCLKYGIPEKNIWCRPNPIDESKFNSVSENIKYDLRSKLTKFQKKDILISYIAQYTDIKNHIFLFDVLTYLPEGYKLFLGGPIVEDGPRFVELNKKFQELSKMAKQDKFIDRIQITSGFIEKIDSYYKMSDVYAFPTLSEGLGTPMLEAVSCGIPVVVTNLPNITDVWISNTENGYLSDLDPKEFAEKIIKATKISKQQMLAQSKKMISIAGTTIIDQQYMELFSKISI